VLYSPTAGMKQVPPQAKLQVIPWTQRHHDHNWLAANFVGAAGNLLLLMLDQEAREWIGNRSPLDSITTHLRGYAGYEARDLMWSYVELASSWARVGRECLVGDMEGCRLTLGLEPADDPLYQWYDADDRRRLVERKALGARMVPRIRTECLEYESDEACDTLLSSLARHEIPPPISVTPRRGFYLMALDLGGDGAYGRLVQSADLTIETRFSRVTGMVMDSVLIHWHAAVIDAAPKRVAGNRWAGVTSLAWVLVFTFAATRSRRWRLD